MSPESEEHAQSRQLLKKYSSVGGGSGLDVVVNTDLVLIAIDALEILDLGSEAHHVALPPGRPA